MQLQSSKFSRVSKANFVKWMVHSIKKKKKYSSVKLVKRAADKLEKESDLINLIKRSIQFERLKNLV